MKPLLLHLEYERKPTLPDGHVLLPVDDTTRVKLQRFLGRPVSQEYLDFLAEYGGTTVYHVPLPCPKSSGTDRLRELPYDVWNLSLYGDYSPDSNGKPHPSSLEYVLKTFKNAIPAGMLPVAEHVQYRFLHYSHRPESYGKLFLYCSEDLPYFDAHDPANARKEPPDPFLACREVAPNLETFFKGLRSFSDEEYDEWADRVNSYI